MLGNCLKFQLWLEKLIKFPSNEKLIWVSFVWKECLFLGVEGKSISLCEMKNYSLRWKGSLFFIKEVIYSSFKRKYEKSLINRQCYKEFVGFGFGFDLRVLPLGRGKVERETKIEIKGFLLGRNARGRRK